jgi:hypothetical protein
MKKLIAIIAVFVSLTAQAQKNKDRSNVAIGTLTLQTFKQCDTLDIADYHKYKYIKLGGRVYKIESPTLSEVKDNMAFVPGVGCPTSGFKGANLERIYYTVPNK